jgi:hypothetical protein
MTISCHDTIKQLREMAITVTGGFHSLLEQEAGLHCWPEPPPLSFAPLALVIAGVRSPYDCRKAINSVLFP